MLFVFIWCGAVGVSAEEPPLDQLVDVAEMASREPVDETLLGGYELNMNTVVVRETKLVEMRSRQAAIAKRICEQSEVGEPFAQTRIRTNIGRVALGERSHMVGGVALIR